ncbi:MAG: hypothetical protein K8I60_05625 [Anaerolineae bacterium]|nr:hypothetical protein [Anaerolineae bacterium]
MRYFELLDQVTIDPESGIIHLTTGRDVHSKPSLAMRREGGYVAISAGYGPLEIALRPRLEELARVLGRLQPVDGLQTTRQVGTGQAYLALGLRASGELIMRPTIVADATGHMSFNLLLTAALRQTLNEWLPAERE